MSAALNKQPRRAAVPWSSGVLAPLLGALIFNFAGCSEQSSDRKAMEMIQYLPLAVVVPKGEEMRRAEDYADHHPGHVALWGVSPRPLAYYGDHAGLVVKEVDFNELRQGMTVIYVTEIGTRAGGLLVRPQDEGWVVKDWGADTVKRQLILPRTLVGVVVLAFVPPDPAPNSRTQPISPDKAANFP